MMIPEQWLRELVRTSLAEVDELRRARREQHRDALLVELGQAPVTAGRAAELARLIHEADDEIAARECAA